MDWGPAEGFNREGGLFGCREEEKGLRNVCPRKTNLQKEGKELVNPNEARW